jgi:zinc protease
MLRWFLVAAVILVLALSFYLSLQKNRGPLSISSAHGMKIERVVSADGIEVWLMEDHSLPVISLSLLFRGGAALDPAGKEGLASMTAGLIDEGAGDLDSRAFQQRLADLAITLRFNASLDTFEGSLRTLTENRDEAFSLLRMALNAPRFDDEPVTRVRNQILTGLAMAESDPAQIADKVWFRAAFPDHPYGRPSEGTKAGVTAVTADDLRSFVKRRFGRDHLIIGVAGDITADELAPLLHSAFGSLPEHAASFEVPDTQVASSGVIVVEEDIPQSTVRFGENGIKRDDPDYFAAQLLNYTLGGGGFSSRLTKEVREKRGLAYSVYSNIQPMAQGGLVSGGVGTDNTKVIESLDLIREEWRRMAEDGVSEDELKDSKTYLTGAFPLRLTSTGRIASMLATLQYLGLGIDYLDRREELIHSVTLDDTRRVAYRLLHADDLLVVVVGKPEGVTATRPAPQLDN